MKAESRAMTEAEKIEEAMDGWHLNSLKLEIATYGKNKGQYEGVLVFSNGDHESFRFKINPDIAPMFLEPVADCIVKNADDLCSVLKDNLKAMLAPRVEEEEQPDES